MATDEITEDTDSTYAENARSIAPDVLAAIVTGLRRGARHADDEADAAPLALEYAVRNMAERGEYDAPAAVRGALLAVTQRRTARQARIVPTDTAEMVAAGAEPFTPARPKRRPTFYLDSVPEDAPEGTRMLAETDPTAAARLRALFSHAATHGARYSASVTGQRVPTTTTERDTVRLADCNAWGTYFATAYPTTRRGDEPLDAQAVSARAFRYLTRSRRYAAREVRGNVVWQGYISEAPYGADAARTEDVDGMRTRFLAQSQEDRRVDGNVRTYGRSRKGRTYRTDRTPAGVSAGISYGMGSSAGMRDTGGTLDAQRAARAADRQERAAEVYAGQEDAPETTAWVAGTDGVVPSPVARRGICPRPIGGTVDGVEAMRCGCASRRAGALLPEVMLDTAPTGEASTYRVDGSGHDAPDALLPLALRTGAQPPRCMVTPNGASMVRSVVLAWRHPSQSRAARDRI